MFNVQFYGIKYIHSIIQSITTIHFQKFSSSQTEILNTLYNNSHSPLLTAPSSSTLCH